MNVNLDAILIVLAFVCFILSALGVSSRVNLVALGLGLWVLTGLI